MFVRLSACLCVRLFVWALWKLSIMKFLEVVCVAFLLPQKEDDERQVRNVNVKTLGQSCEERDPIWSSRVCVAAASGRETRARSKWRRGPASAAQRHLLAGCPAGGGGGDAPCFAHCVCCCGSLTSSSFEKEGAPPPPPVVRRATCRPYPAMAPPTEPGAPPQSDQSSTRRTKHGWPLMKC